MRILECAFIIVVLECFTHDKQEFGVLFFDKSSSVDVIVVIYKVFKWCGVGSFATLKLFMEFLIFQEIAKRSLEVESGSKLSHLTKGPIHYYPLDTSQHG